LADRRDREDNNPMVEDVRTHVPVRDPRYAWAIGTLHARHQYPGVLRGKRGTTARRGKRATRMLPRASCLLPLARLIRNVDAAAPVFPGNADARARSRQVAIRMPIADRLVMGLPVFPARVCNEPM